jgi:hypothetical protein
MKVQLQGQCLRLRLDEAGLAGLLAGDEIRNTTVLGTIRYTQAVHLLDAPAPVLRADPAGWSIGLPRAALADYIRRLPCREALTFLLPATGAAPLQLAFEVDVRDSVRTRGARRRVDAR